MLTATAAMVLMVLGAGHAAAAPNIPLGGGSGILLPENADSAAACTITTIGYDKAGDLIGLTAGHCGPAGRAVYSEKFANRGKAGEVVYSTPDLDFAVIKFDKSKVAPLRSVGGVTIRGIQTTPPQFPSVACKTGRTTGNTCGVTWFSNGQAHITQMCIAEGDSGSPVVIGDRLIGMVNGYFEFACLGPETGTNIGPILDRMNKVGFSGFHVY